MVAPEKGLASHLIRQSDKALHGRSTEEELGVFVKNILLCTYLNLLFATYVSLY